MDFEIKVDTQVTDRFLLAQALEVIMLMSKQSRSVIDEPIRPSHGHREIFEKLKQAEQTIHNLDELLAKKAKTCDELSDIMATQLKQLKEVEAHLSACRDRIKHLETARNIDQNTIEDLNARVTLLQ